MSKHRLLVASIVLVLLGPSGSARAADTEQSSAAVEAAGSAEASTLEASSADAEEASREIVQSLRALEDSLVIEVGTEGSRRSQAEIQSTIAQVEDLGRLIRDGASKAEIKERFRTLEIQRRRLAALSAAAPKDHGLPPEMVQATTAKWAALAAYVASLR
jgi:hypothetical protein